MNYRFPHAARPTIVALVAAALASVTSVARVSAQQPAYKRDLPPTLARQAKISETTAAKKALARMKDARIQAVELENESGRLIYSYELKRPGHSGVEEVNVNAKTGAVVNIEHETAEAERSEAKQEKKESVRKPKPKPGRRDTTRTEVR